MSDAKPFIARQGDVLLVPVAEIPAEAKPVAAIDGRVILALGEATGHSHSIASGAVLFRPDDMPSGIGGYLEVGADGALLTHQEHSTIALPSGLYRQAVQVEETPEVVRQVAD